MHEKSSQEKVGCMGVEITRTCYPDGTIGPVNDHLTPDPRRYEFFIQACSKRTGADKPVCTKFWCEQKLHTIRVMIIHM